MVTIRTAEAGEPFMQIAAFQIFVNVMRNHRPTKAVVASKASVIAGLELGKVGIEQLAVRVTIAADFSDDRYSTGYLFPLWHLRQQEGATLYTLRILKLSLHHMPYKIFLRYCK